MHALEKGWGGGGGGGEGWWRWGKGGWVEAWSAREQLNSFNMAAWQAAVSMYFKISGKMQIINE